MNNLCLFFQVHHPLHLQRFHYFDQGKSKNYFKQENIQNEITRYTQNFITPANEALLKLIKQTEGKLKVSFYLSGVALDLFLTYAPRVLNSFQKLADSGSVEFTGGTACHSIISLAGNREEFRHQATAYHQRIAYFFNQEPQIFVNSDLLYSNEIAKMIGETGYRAVLVSGTSKLLGNQSPNFLYQNAETPDTLIFARNETVSNTLETIFAGKNFVRTALSPANLVSPEEPVTSICIDYSKLGGLKRGRFSLFKQFVNSVANSEHQRFSLPSEIIGRYGAVGNIDVPEPVCWKERFHPDYYPGNDLQKDAITQLKRLIKKAEQVSDYTLKNDCLYLGQTDHFHLMDDNMFTHQPENLPFGYDLSKYDYYINYMNILDDLEQRIKEKSQILKQGKAAVPSKTDSLRNLKEQKAK